MSACERPEQIDTAFSAVSRAHAQALYVIENARFFTRSNDDSQVAGFQKTRLPTIYWDRQLADAGGLTSYGPNPADLLRLIGRVCRQDPEGCEAR